MPPQGPAEKPPVIGPDGTIKVPEWTKQPAPAEVTAYDEPTPAPEAAENPSDRAEAVAAATARVERVAGASSMPSGVNTSEPTGYPANSRAGGPEYPGAGRGRDVVYKEMTPPPPGANVLTFDQQAVQAPKEPSLVKRLLNRLQGK